MVDGRHLGEGDRGDEEISAPCSGTSVAATRGRGWRPHLSMSVSRRFSRLEAQSEAEVGNAGAQVGLQQDILTLKVPERRHTHTEHTMFQQHTPEGEVSRCRCPVPVCDGGLVSVLVSRYVFVQVGQSSGHGLSDDTQLGPGQDVGLQVVAQRTLPTRSTSRYTSTRSRLSLL